MSDIRCKPTFARMSDHKSFNLLLKRVGHLVEGDGPSTELVMSVNRKTSFQEPLRKRPSGLTGPGDGSKGASRDYQTHKSGQYHYPQPSAKHDACESVQLSFEGACRE